MAGSEFCAALQKRRLDDACDAFNMIIEWYPDAD